MHGINNNKSAGEIRSGSILSHDNTWSGFNSGHNLQNFRNYKPSVHWGPVNGKNLWDKNEPNGSTGYWATGTHTGVNGSRTLVDTNVTKTWWDSGGQLRTGAWPINRWWEAGASYMVRNMSKETTDILENHVWAMANDGNTIDCSVLSFDDSHVTFDYGDRYEIWKVTKAFDQPGQGKSDLLSGLGTYPTGTTALS